MKRIVHIANNFEDADQWDREQQLLLKPRERMVAAFELRIRVYGEDAKDVRACHRNG